jgi:transposase-like protein
MCQEFRQINYRGDSMSMDASSIIEVLRMISPTQLINFKELIFPEESKKTKISDEEFLKLINDRFFNTEKLCPGCGGSNFVKNGKNRLGRQRYVCKDCERIFSDTTGSPLSYTKKPPEQWIKYMKCMSKGLTLRESAEIVKINRNTAFHWRHKILSAIKSKLKDNLSGIVEIAEVPIKESFKGNHSKSKDPLKNKKFERTNLNPFVNDGRKIISILCCKDRDNSIFAQAACNGRVGYIHLNTLLDKKIREGSVICTNNNSAYISFAKIQNLKLYKIMFKNQFTDEIHHINNVKTFGNQFKIFINGFKGVATKYINFYLSWFKWLEASQAYIKDFRAFDLYLLFSSSCKKLRISDFGSVRAF